MKVKKLHGMGNHLIIDASGCNRSKIGDTKLVKIFLKELIRRIDMKIIKGPIVLNYKSSEERENGITGFAILAESHVSIHTYPMKGFFSLDIFSCVEFDIKKIKGYINQTFDVKKIKEFLIKRECEAKNLTNF